MGTVTSPGPEGADWAASNLVVSFGKKIREKRQSATALSAIYHRGIETHTERMNEIIRIYMW